VRICRTLVILALQMLMGASMAWGDERQVECKHFWKMGAERVLSGKEVGADVGNSPYGSDGVYECRIFITQHDVLEGRYLFLGEVGDASYVQPVSGPNVPLASLPIYHGLSPDATVSSRYLRFVPFVVSLRDLYQADGWHTFELHYRDLIPLQTGIRSGRPSIESTQGAIQRAVFNAPGLSYHLVQIIVFIVIGISVLWWRGVPAANRLRLAATSFGAGAVVVSITSLPRFFLSNPLLTIQINDVVNMISLAMTFLPLVGNVEFQSGRFKWVAGGIIGFACVYSATYWFFPAGGTAGFRVFSFGALIFASLYPLGLFWMWRTGVLRPTVSLAGQGITGSSYWLLFFSLLGFWDAGINLLLLNIQFQFFLTHFLFWLPALIWQIRLQAKESEAQRILPNEIDKIKNVALRKIAADPVGARSLDEVCQGYAQLTGADRVSIVEILEGQIKFHGIHGSYERVEGLQPLATDSLIRTVEKTGVLQSGVTAVCTVPKIGVAAPKTWSSEFYILPLRHQGRLRGAFCLTNFNSGYMSAFLRQRLGSLQSEVEVLFSLLLLERDNRAQANLLQMARLRVHAMQLKSEKYFLDSFVVSDRMQQPAFIVGDLVDSTPLNKVYGAHKTRSIIHQFLERLFERFKHLGIIVSSRNGDEISIIIPNQEGDDGPEAAIARAYEVIESLSFDSDLAQIAKENGIGIPFQFKYAASQASNPNENEALSSAIGLLSVVTDSEIDSAYRVMSKVALAGECILLPRLAQEIGKYADLIEVSRDRLKGISSSLSFYLLSRNANRRIANAKSWK